MAVVSLKVGLITTAEAAVLLRVTPGRVRQLIGNGQLESEKRGRDHLLDQAEVERFDHKTAEKAGGPGSAKNIDVCDRVL